MSPETTRGDLWSTHTSLEPLTSSRDAVWLALTERLSLQASAWNLTDETYLSWAFARGQTEGSATLDRFTSPGRSFGLQARLSF